MNLRRHPCRVLTPKLLRVFLHTIPMTTLLLARAFTKVHSNSCIVLADAVACRAQTSHPIKVITGTNRSWHTAVERQTCFLPLSRKLMLRTSLLLSRWRAGKINPGVTIASPKRHKYVVENLFLIANGRALIAAFFPRAFCQKNSPHHAFLSWRHQRGSRRN